MPWGTRGRGSTPGKVREHHPLGYWDQRRGGRTRDHETSSGGGRPGQPETCELTTPLGGGIARLSISRKCPLRRSRRLRGGASALVRSPRQLVEGAALLNGRESGALPGGMGRLAHAR